MTQLKKPVWREVFVFFPKTDSLSHKRIWGVVMRLDTCEGPIFRAMTDEEQAERMKDEAW